MDMPESEENLKEFKQKLSTNYDEFDEQPLIFPISSLAHQGLENLLEATAELLDKTDEFLLYDESEFQEEEVYYGFNPDDPEFDITRGDDASWILSGDKLEKLFTMTNFDRDESVMKFARQLRGMGVDEALRVRGAKDGDIVRIGKFEFEFVD
ncbi:Spo0B-associated GTP-binding protein [Chlamydia trachomatis]|nr:Spo0B-associated GTP-binding protein [Chlamydia trachomatis]